MTRRGDWIQTHTGRRFWPLDPLPDDITIEDIAHALAMTCRYGGHVLRFYSVAEHSFLVAQHVAPEHRLAALLHDAAEAYLPDVPSPTKRFLPGFKDIEREVEKAVAARFGVEWPWHPSIKAVDLAIRQDEARLLMAPPPEPWAHEGLPLGLAEIDGWPPRIAERLFLTEFRGITGAWS